MTKTQKARMITMIIISILLIASVYGYGYEIGKLTYPVDYVSDVNIDSSDFTEIANLLIFGTNSFLGLIYAVVYSIAMLTISLILLLPWRFIAIRKKSIIAPVEMKVVTIAYISVCALSFLLGFVAAEFTSLLIILALTLVVAIMFGLCCYFPYRLAYKKYDKKNENDNRME